MTRKEKAIINDFHSTKIYTDDPKQKHSNVFGAGWDACLKAHETALKMFTCHNCKAVESCEFAWDHYNTSGDCLAGK